MRLKPIILQYQLYLTMLPAPLAASFTFCSSTLQRTTWYRAH